MKIRLWEGCSLLMVEVGMVRDEGTNEGQWATMHGWGTIACISKVRQILHWCKVAPFFMLDTNHKVAEHSCRMCFYIHYIHLSSQFENISKFRSVWCWGSGRGCKVVRDSHMPTGDVVTHIFPVVVWKLIPVCGKGDCRHVHPRNGMKDCSGGYLGYLVSGCGAWNGV